MHVFLDHRIPGGAPPRTDDTVRVVLGDTSRPRHTEQPILDDPDRDILVADQLLLRDCLITGNSAENGGALAVTTGGASSATIINCTLADNSAPLGGAIQASTGQVSVTVKNSILWGNTSPQILFSVATVSVDHSTIQNGQFSSNPTNISADPLFLDPNSGDYHIASSSPCVDGGTNAIAGLAAVDLDGTPRIANGTIDMGVDEIPLTLLPGSADDLDLYSWLNGAGDPLGSQKVAAQGDLISLRFTSPGGALTGAVPWILAQLFSSGSAPIGIPGLPVYVDVFSSVTLYGGLPVVPFSIPGLPPAGVDLYYQIPPGLGGFTLRVQAAAISPAAGNGLFAVTPAHDIIIP